MPRPSGPKTLSPVSTSPPGTRTAHILVSLARVNKAEVRKNLRWSGETFDAAVSVGVKLPKSGKLAKLKATKVGDDWDVDESDLNSFIAQFHDEEPGRHPPVAVCRELATECRHLCSICAQSHPLQYHHILQWSELSHYDPKHMLAICGSCHDKVHDGTIDRKAQYIHKRRLQEQNDRGGRDLLWGERADQVPWDELAMIIETLHRCSREGSQAGSSGSKFDYSQVPLETVKNKLNGLSDTYFKVMSEVDEPHFYAIQAFLQSPNNNSIRQHYYEVIDDLRRRIAIAQTKGIAFDSILEELRDAAVRKCPDELKGKRMTMNRLLSFMYFTCDIGRKS